MEQGSDRHGTVASDDGRLELALRASNEGIWDWWTGRQDIYYSRRILEFLECGGGMAPNFFLPPHEMVHEEDREKFARALALALDEGGPELFSADCRLRTGGGDWPWMRIRGTVVRDRRGKAERIAGSMINISRRKAAEAQIEEERYLLRMLIDHVPLQVYFKDMESKFVLANQKMAEWMGLEDPGQLTGKHDRDFFDRRHANQAEEDEREIMKTGKGVVGKLEREGWDERHDTWVLTSKFPWHDSRGRVNGTFGVSSDVTELVEAQQAAANLAGELAERNKSYEKEVQLAREIQQTLSTAEFPVTRLNGRHLEYGARYLPISGLAGDFYEVVRISDTEAGLLICDVMGHGVRSALVVAMLRGLLEKQKSRAASPEQYLSGLNDGLQSILEKAGTTMFATAFYAVVDLGSNVIRYACAGHPGAMVTGAKGVTQLCGERSERGPGLGLIHGAEFPPSELPLEEVSRLLFFTDGIVEAENEDREPFLEKRLMEVLAERSEEPLDEMLDGVLKTVLDFAEGNHFDDDVCLLGMEVAGHS